MKRLGVLPPNKSYTFQSPLEDNLIRTGTIGEGSCFFHAVIHGYSSNYRSWSITKRKSYVIRLRNIIANKLTKEKWKELSNGYVALISTQENIRKTLKGFYDYFTKKNYLPKLRDKILLNVLEPLMKESLKNYIIMVDNVDYKEIDINILSINAQNIDEYISTINKNATGFFNSITDRLDVDNNFISTILTLFDIISKEAEDYSYMKYKESLGEVCSWIDQTQIGLLSDTFKKNIFIIDGSTRMPYEIGGCDYFRQDRKNVIIIWVGRGHYEVLGRLLEDGTVQREFEWEDQLIQKIYLFLCHKEEVTKRYPELMEYLPKLIKEREEVDEE